MAKHIFYQFFLLLITYQISISNCEIRQVPCSMYEYNKKCTISGLTLTLKNYTFSPFASNPNIVVKFELTSSIIPVLTGEACTKFTKLKNFIAIQQHVEIIDDYAFNNCTELTEINLEKNNIYKLGKGVFSNAKQLQRLHLLGASLPEIEDDLLSNLSELNQLVYSASGLRELKISAIKNLKKLQYLYLYSNDLSDLDADGLLKNLPSLKTIYINDNNFHCDRLSEIVATFKAKNIVVHDHTFNIFVKKRDYIPRKVSNIICLSQAQLENEKLKKALTSSLDGLKEYPIGQAVIKLNDVVTSGFTDADSTIVALSNTLNETSDNLNEQINVLNGTLQTTSTEINDAINDLRNNSENHKANQKILEEKLNFTSTQLQETTKRLQEIADSVALMMDKYNTSMANSAISEKLNGNNANESLGYNLTAVWVLLICMLLSMVAISFFVYKKFRNIHVDVPILCYENRSDEIGNERQQQSFT